MELILINNNKMKVILDKSDMEKLKICANDLDYQNTETKRVIWEILDIAKQQTGFDTARSKLSIQVFSSIDGGCEMFITKESLPSPLQKHTASQYRPSAQSVEKGIYIQLNFEELIEICKRLNNTNVSLDSSLYLKGDNIYILSLTLSSTPSLRSPNNTSFIPQYVYSYGSPFPINNVTMACINEHYKEIISFDAISIIADL